MDGWENAVSHRLCSLLWAGEERRDDLGPAWATLESSDRESVSSTVGVEEGECNGSW